MMLKTRDILEMLERAKQKLSYVSFFQDQKYSISRQLPTLLSNDMNLFQYVIANSFELGMEWATFLVFQKFISKLDF